MKLFKSKKGQLVTFLVFVFLSIIIILVTGVIAPLGARINSEFYLAGEQILLDTNDTIQSIQNTTIRDSLTDTMNKGLASTQSNIEINTGLYKYSWVIVLAALIFIFFLATRQQVEAGGRTIA